MTPGGWAIFRLSREMGLFLRTEPAARLENRRRKKFRPLFIEQQWRRNPKDRLVQTVSDVGWLRRWRRKHA